MIPLSDEKFGILYGNHIYIVLQDKMKQIIVAGIFTVIGAIIGGLVSHHGVVIFDQLMGFLGIEFILPLCGGLMCLLVLHGTSNRPPDLDPIRDPKAHDEYNRKRSSVWLLWKWLSRKLRGKPTRQMEREIESRGWGTLIGSSILFLTGIIMILFWVVRLILFW
jgi:hypothetical protein